MNDPDQDSHDAPSKSAAESPRTESHLRSILKALSWRIVATTTTTLIAWYVSGEVGTALQIGFYEFLFKIFVYYLHERLWQLVPRGVIRKLFRHK